MPMKRRTAWNALLSAWRSCAVLSAVFAAPTAMFGKTGVVKIGLGAILVACAP